MMSSWIQAARQRPGRALAALIGAVLLLPVVLIVFYRWLAPPTTTFMLANEQQPVHHRWVDARNISPAVALAVIASEDQKFPDHWGFDFDAMRAALRERGRKSAARGDAHAKLRGASTISQQTAKNLFLWGGHSFIRKGVEAGLTLEMELLWPKRRILEVYLNVAQFGPDVFGVEAAARTYFSKPASQLSTHEAALLAAVLPNPRQLKVQRPSAYVLDRANEIEAQMRNLGSGLLADLRWPRA